MPKIRHAGFILPDVATDRITLTLDGGEYSITYEYHYRPSPVVVAAARQMNV